MPSAEYDLRYLDAGVKLLEGYLLSKDVYWPVGVTPPPGETPYPRLTLGGMELALLRARARALNASQQAQLAKIDEQMDAVRSRWRVAWGQKATAEFHARLTLWRNFIEEYRESPESNASRYPYEVSRRVLLHLLGAEANSPPQAELDLLDGLDRFVRAVLTPGDFFGTPSCSPVFHPTLTGICTAVYGVSSPAGNIQIQSVGAALQHPHSV